MPMWDADFAARGLARYITVLVPATAFSKESLLQMFPGEKKKNKGYLLGRGKRAVSENICMSNDACQDNVSEYSIQADHFLSILFACPTVNFINCASIFFCGHYTHNLPSHCLFPLCTRYLPHLLLASYMMSLYLLLTYQDIIALFYVACIFKIHVYFFTSCCFQEINNNKIYNKLTACFK